MTKSSNSKNKSKNEKRGKKGGAKKKKDAGKRPRRVDAIVFDPEARRQYLTGFSQRKQERRAFGLAMQKVKDRTARLANRAELRSVTREQIAEAEERRRQRMEDDAKNKAVPPTRTEEKQQQKRARDNLSSNKETKIDPLQTTDQINEEKADTVVQTYEGEETQQQWGGLVVVTTSTNVPDSDDDNGTDHGDGEGEEQNDCRKQQPKKQLDAQQEYAGNVEKYLKDLKGHLPSKKNKAGNNNKRHRGGQHGAANMKGVGSAAHLKVAQKVLARSTAAAAASQTKGGGKSAGGGKKRSTKR
jgi:ribosomal RNA-processing protein 17